MLNKSSNENKRSKSLLNFKTDANRMNFLNQDIQNIKLGKENKKINLLEIILIEKKLIFLHYLIKQLVYNCFNIANILIFC